MTGEEIIAANDKLISELHRINWKIFNEKDCEWNRKHKQTKKGE